MGSLDKARMEVAELFAALLEDTAQKMRVDEAYDRTYLLEDLLTRGGQLANEFGDVVTRDSFPTLNCSVDIPPAYPLFPEEDV